MIDSFWKDKLTSYSSAAGLSPKSHWLLFPIKKKNYGFKTIRILFHVIIKKMSSLTISFEGYILAARNISQIMQTLRVKLIFSSIRNQLVTLCFCFKTSPHAKPFI